MNKSTIIMVIIILGLAYYCYQNNQKTQSTGSSDQTELTDLKVPEEKEIRDSLGNFILQAEKPILSHKQKRQLKKQPKK